MNVQDSSESEFIHCAECGELYERYKHGGMFYCQECLDEPDGET